MIGRLLIKPLCWLILISIILLCSAYALIPHWLPGQIRYHTSSLLEGNGLQWQQLAISRPNFNSLSIELALANMQGRTAIELRLDAHYYIEDLVKNHSLYHVVIQSAQIDLSQLPAGEGAPSPSPGTLYQQLLDSLPLTKDIPLQALVIRELELIGLSPPLNALKVDGGIEIDRNSDIAIGTTLRFTDLPPLDLAVSLIQPNQVSVELGFENIRSHCQATPLPNQLGAQCIFNLDGTLAPRWIALINEMLSGALPIQASLSELEDIQLQSEFKLNSPQQFTGTLEPDQLSGTLQSSLRSKIQLNDPQASGEIELVLQGYSDLTWPQWQHKAMPSTLKGIIQSDASLSPLLQGSNTISFQLKQLQADGQAEQLESIRASAQASLENGKDSYNLAIDMVDLTSLSPLALVGQGHINITSNSLLKMAEATGQISHQQKWQFKLDKNQLQWRSTLNHPTVLSNLKQDDIQLKRATISAKNPWDVVLNYPSMALKTANIEATLTPIEIKLPEPVYLSEIEIAFTKRKLAALELRGSSLEYQAADVEVSSKEWAVNLNELQWEPVLNTEIAYQLNDLTIKASDISQQNWHSYGDYNLINDQLSGQSKWRYQQTNLGTTDIVFDTSTYRGEASIDLKLPPVEIYPKWLPRLSPDLKDMLLTQGNILLNGDTGFDLNTQDILTDTQIDLTVADLSGSYTEIPFENLSGQWRLSRAIPLKLDTISPLQIENIGVGSVISDFSLASRVYENEVGLHADIDMLSFNLFSGKWWTEDSAYHSTQPTQLNLKFSGVDLGNVSAVIEQRNIQMAGVIDGTLPIILYPNMNIEFGKGYIRNQGIGRLQLTGDAVKELAGDNLAATIAMEALSNLHVNELRADIAQKTGRDVVLSAKLNGQNPDLKGDQPIELNFSLTAPLFSLLNFMKSYMQGDFGKMEQNIEESIQRKLRQRKVN